MSDMCLSLSLFQEGDDEAERMKMREVSKRLYAQLQEAEKKHQEERERLQVTHTHILSWVFRPSYKCFLC